MDTSKSKLQVSKHFPKAKLGSSTSSNSSQLDTPKKKDYSKNKKPDDIGYPSFGQTGLTGES